MSIYGPCNKCGRYDCEGIACQMPTFTSDGAAPMSTNDKAQVRCLNCGLPIHKAANFDIFGWLHDETNRAQCDNRGYRAEPPAAAPSGFVCTHCYNAGALSALTPDNHGRYSCPRCNYLVIVLRRGEQAEAEFAKELAGAIEQAHQRPGGRESYLLPNELASALLPRIRAYVAQRTAELERQLAEAQAQVAAVVENCGKALDAEEAEYCKLAKRATDVDVQSRWLTCANVTKRSAEIIRALSPTDALARLKRDSYAAGQQAFRVHLEECLAGRVEPENTTMQMLDEWVAQREQAARLAEHAAHCLDCCDALRGLACDCGEYGWQRKPEAIINGHYACPRRRELEAKP